MDPSSTPQIVPETPSSLPLDDYTAEINALLRMVAAFRSVLGQLENFVLSLTAKSTRPGPPTSPSGAHNSPDSILRPTGSSEGAVKVMEILKQAEESGQARLTGRRTVRRSRTPIPTEHGEEDHELPAAAN